MSEAPAEVPVLGLGRETMTTLQQTAFALLSMLQQHRMMAGHDGIGREAWSDVEASDRRTARQIRVADPDVRLMRHEEGRAFDAAAARPGGVEVRRVTTAAGDVEVGVAPLGPDGAWGLRASSTGGDGATAHVQCVDERTAQRLAHDILRRGPQSVGKLHRYARDATRRAAEAGAELAEPESERLRRAAEAVRHTWADRAGLAERVIAGPAQTAAGVRGYNPAFGALAYRLAQLEERGFPMGHVLERLDVDTLSDPSIRNPAAFAEYLVQGMASRLPVLNLDPEVSGSRAAAAVSDGPDEDVAAAVDGPAGVQSAAQERAAETVLQQALPGDVWRRVRKARGYPRLREDLGRRIEGGQDVAALVQHLPTEHIVRAHDPAGYLRAVIQRAARGTAPPRGAPTRTLDPGRSRAARPRCRPRRRRGRLQSVAGARHPARRMADTGAAARRDDRGPARGTARQGPLPRCVRQVGARATVAARGDEHGLKESRTRRPPRAEDPRRAARKGRAAAGRPMKQRSIVRQRRT